MSTMSSDKSTKRTTKYMMMLF